MASRRIFSIALVATFITAAAAPASASPSAQLRCTELLTALHDEIASGKLPPGKILTLRPGARAPVIYFTDLNKRDEFAAARNLHEPILILHGRRDYQVTDADIAEWRSNLKGVPDVTIRQFPSLNHLFIVGTGKPGPADYEKPGHVAAPAIEAIESFIDHPSGPSHQD